MITYQAVNHLVQIKEKTQEAKNYFDPESTAIQEASLTGKLELLGQPKTVGIEAQHSVEEWKMFSKNLLQTTPSIYQTTFEGIPHLPTEQSGKTSMYRHNFQFFNPSPSESNILTTNHHSRNPEVIIEGSEKSHVQIKTTPLPPNIRMHEWEIPQETHEHIV